MIPRDLYEFLARIQQLLRDTKALHAQLPKKSRHIDADHARIKLAHAHNYLGELSGYLDIKLAALEKEKK